MILAYGRISRPEWAGVRMSVHPRRFLCNADEVQVLSWFWPFAATPDRSTGLEFEVNGFEGECCAIVVYEL